MLSPNAMVAIFQAMIFILICSIGLKAGRFDFRTMFGDQASMWGWFWAIVALGIALKIALVLGVVIKKA